MKKLYIYLGCIIFINANKSYGWNVSFNPSSPEIRASQDSSTMLTFLNTLTNWGCAILAVYLLHSAAKKLHDSNIGGFIRTFTASFLVGSAPYFSQYFQY